MFCIFMWKYSSSLLSVVVCHDSSCFTSYWIELNWIISGSQHKPLQQRADILLFVCNYVYIFRNFPFSTIHADAIPFHSNHFDLHQRQFTLARPSTREITFSISRCPELNTISRFITISSAARKAKTKFSERKCVA